MQTRSRASLYLRLFSSSKLEFCGRSAGLRANDLQRRSRGAKDVDSRGPFDERPARIPEAISGSRHKMRVGAHLANFGLFADIGENLLFAAVPL